MVDVVFLLGDARCDQTPSVGTKTCEATTKTGRATAAARARATTVHGSGSDSGRLRPPKLYLDHAEVRALIEDLSVEFPELNQVPVERVMDNSVLRELEEKGYFSMR